MMAGMIQAAALAISLAAASQAECGTFESLERIDEAANAVVYQAVMADLEGRPQDSNRYFPPEGVASMDEALAQLPRGWLAGSRPVSSREIGVWSLNRSGLVQNAMLVRIGAGDDPIYRRVHLRCRTDGMWVITAVVWGDDEPSWEERLSAQD